ncbi:MAG TPA: carotenoid biosynthesis protein [Ktedonobacteraceae bacterium]
MKVVTFLFVAYLALLACCLAELLLVSPAFSFWQPDASSLALFQVLVQRSTEIQILLGTMLMLLFGCVCVGFFQTLSCFAICVPVALVLSGKTLWPGLAALLTLLPWFFMGFASYLLAGRLVTRLGLPRQALWSLLLGTYFLLAWNVTLDVVLAGARLPGQSALWRQYASSIGPPSFNLVSCTLAALLLLSISRLFWRGQKQVQQCTIWLPFSLYTANIGFTLLLSIGSGLWLPLIFATCLVLMPESLAYFPRQQARPTHRGPLHAVASQLAWLIMRVGVRVSGRRRLHMSAAGVEHIPRQGPVLVAANHVHFFFDGYILLRAIPRRLHTLVALDWVQVRGLRLLIELACALADWPIVLRSEQMRAHTGEQPRAYQPVEHRLYLRQVINDTLRLLRASEILVMFPEAYPAIDPHPTFKRAPDEFLPFRPGFLKLVALAERDQQTRVAIVPAGLRYTSSASSAWQATVRFGQALFLSDFASPEEALHAVEERVQALALAPSSPPPLPPGEPFSR